MRQTNESERRHRLALLGAAQTRNAIEVARIAGKLSLLQGAERELHVTPPAWLSPAAEDERWFTEVLHRHFPAPELIEYSIGERVRVKLRVFAEIPWSDVVRRGQLAMFDLFAVDMNLSRERALAADKLEEERAATWKRAQRAMASVGSDIVFEHPKEAPVAAAEETRAPSPSDVAGVPC